LASFLLASTVLTGAAQAVAITEVQAGFGQALDLDPADFRASGPCGSGRSVTGDGCSVVRKSDPGAADAYGRRDPWGGTWIDSQDLAEVTWTMSFRRPVTQLVLALSAPRFARSFSAARMVGAPCRAAALACQQEASGIAPCP